MQAESELSFHV